MELQAHAQRLLLVANSSPGHTPFSPAVSHHMILPQNEQLAVGEVEHTGSFMNPAAAAAAAAAAVAVAAGTAGGIVASPGQVQNLAVSNDVSEPASVQTSDDEVEVVAHERVMDFVACHAAAADSPASGGGHVHDSSSSSSSTLAEIFRCFICLGKVVDAQLCPCCSKLVCQPCIKRWLTDQKSECPHCRAPLLVSQLVSCRFISEISLEVEKIQGKLGDSPTEKYCPAHDSPLLYFCTTCAVAVCSDCAVLIEDHRNHTFEKLSVAYGRHKKKIRIEAAGLRKRRKELSALVASVDKNIETVLKSKDEAAVELQMAFKRMQSRLEEQLKCKLLALLAQKGSMTQEMELLDTILHELDQQLNSIPKSDLIAQEPNMSRMLQDIRTRTFSEISRTPIPPEFTSEVVPAYEHGELVLKNYKETQSQTRPTVIIPAGGNSNSSEEVLLMSKDVVYSEPICASGVTWRLKVYPNGSGASQGTHLSVFLEMVEGGTEAATYEYGIELQHRARPNQRIVRKFSSDFEEGACWGYYQFFRLDLLEKEGYLQPDDDTLTLKFYVRPVTYQQQCQDLRRSLAALQAERDESATQVAVIRRAFAATFFQRRRRRTSRGALATSEQVAFAQAVAAGAGMDMASSAPSPAVLAEVRKTAASIPSMRQLQLKMQEYQCSNAASRAEKWLQPESCAFGATGDSVVGETSPCEDPFGEFVACSHAVVVDDEDVEEAAEELTDMRRKSRKHAQEVSKGEEPSVQTPKPHARAHKKLRGRKMHKLTVLAPEALTDHFIGGTGAVTGITAGLVQHFEGLSMVEAGPSSARKKAVQSVSRSGGDTKERVPHPSSRERGEEKGHCDAPEAPIVECTNTAEGKEEISTHAYSNSAMSSTSFCAPEIEDWGNLKNDQP